MGSDSLISPKEAEDLGMGDDDEIREACRLGAIPGAVRLGSRWFLPEELVSEWARYPKRLEVTLLAARRGVVIDWRGALNAIVPEIEEPIEVRLIGLQGEKDPSLILGHADEYSHITDKTYSFSLEIKRIYEGINAGQYVITMLARDEQSYPDRRLRFLTRRQNWDGRLRHNEQLCRLVADIDRELWASRNGDRTPSQVAAEARARGEQPRKRTQLA